MPHHKYSLDLSTFERNTQWLVGLKGYICLPSGSCNSNWSLTGWKIARHSRTHPTASKRFHSLHLWLHFHFLFGHGSDDPLQCVRICFGRREEAQFVTVSSEAYRWSPPCRRTESRTSLTYSQICPVSYIISYVFP